MKLPNTVTVILSTLLTAAQAIQLGELNLNMTTHTVLGIVITILGVLIHPPTLRGQGDPP